MEMLSIWTKFEVRLEIWTVICGCLCAKCSPKLEGLAISCVLNACLLVKDWKYWALSSYTTNCTDQIRESGSIGRMVAPRRFRNPDKDVFKLNFGRDRFLMLLLCLKLCENLCSYIKNLGCVYQYFRYVDDILVIR